MQRFELPILALIIVAYLIVGGLYATKTPAWQVPDEPAHYNYVAQVAKSGCCPTLQAGDWDSQYLDQLKAEHFKPALLDRLSTIRYEDHQPPLFYLLEAPVYSLSGGSLIAMRLFSVLIGVGVVLAAYLTVRTAFPAQPYLALATAAFVAFLPQHVAMLAGVDNDSLTEFIVGLTLLACVRFTSPTVSGATHREGLLLGLLVGLGFVTKATAYALVAVVGLTLLLRARREHWSVRQLIRVSIYVAIPALILGGAWWLRNFSVYGFPDFLGLRRHDLVVVGQLRTADYIAQSGLGAVLRDGLQTTFHSFWGQFGWMGVVMPNNVFSLLTLFTLGVLVGALLAFIRFRAYLITWQRDALLILGLAGLLAFILFVYYNLSFVQFQGRYLFTGLIPIGFFVAAGLTGWAALIPVRAARWVIVAVTFAFALFAIYALYKFIIPGLA